MDYVDIIFAHRYDPEVPLEEVINLFIGFKNKLFYIYLNKNCFFLNFIKLRYAELSIELLIRVKLFIGEYNKKLIILCE